MTPTQTASVEKPKVKDGKHTAQVSPNSIRARATTTIHQTPLQQRLVSRIETTTSSKLDRKSLPLTTQDFENSPVQNKNSEKQNGNAVKILNFIDHFNIGGFTTVDSLKSYLGQVSIDLNDSLFFENFSSLYFIKINLSFTKALIDFNLNLNTNEYNLLIFEKLNVLIKVKENEIINNINFILNSSGLLQNVNTEDTENAKDIMETIKFFASQTSSDQIRNIAATIKSKTHQKNFLAAFDEGRKERWDRTQGLHTLLIDLLPSALSTITTDYINESPDIGAQRPTDIPPPDPSSCCVIL
ncbi:hypothetical protein [Polaromonas vacuolata]|uniref:hypothetical protein n=1 Tax=Polaromonas vacuolata TaxID=37448 RepID=UPI0014578E6A|nr:hypothetical protein [Polaromonas vacuolata]